MKKYFLYSLGFVLLVCFVKAGPLLENVPFYQGMNGYNTFRIPAMIQAPDGTILAVCEGRKNSSSDTGDIDTVLRRSFDGGLTWQPLQIIWDDGPNTCGNPTLLVDSSNGRVWLFSTHNLGQDTQREIADGTSDGVRTIWSCYSDDNGATWTAPVNRFNEVQPPDTRWDATGPGNGIQLKHDPYAGRLIVPAINRNIQSDDHGLTWSQSGSLPYGSSEATVAEVTNSSLMRNDRPTGSYKQYNRRIACYSYNYGQSWSNLIVRNDLVGPVCQASMITHQVPSTGENLVVFSNPANTSRIRMTVKISHSNGQSFEESKLIYPDSSAYSSLASLSTGDLALLYENGDGWPYHRITFAKFSPEWINEKTILVWDFEDFSPGQSMPTTPDAVKDKAGYGLDATCEEAFDVAAGSEKYNGTAAVRFSGSGKGISLDDDDSRDLLDFDSDMNFIIRVIFRTNEHASGGTAEAGALVSKDVGPNVPSWWMRIQDGRARMFIEDGYTGVSLYGDKFVSDGKWHQLVVIRDTQKNKLHMMLDGESAGEALDTTLHSFANNNNLMVGCFNGGLRSFKGDIDKVEIIRGGIDDVLTAYDGDLNLDKIVDIRDLVIISSNWLENL